MKPWSRLLPGRLGLSLKSSAPALFRRSAREFVKDFVAGINPLITGPQVKDPKLARALSTWGIGIEATALAMTFISSSINDETAERWINFTGNMMMATALVLDDIVGGYKAFAGLSDVAKLSTSAKIWEFARKVDVKGFVSGCLLDLGIIWGTFPFQYFMGGGSSMSAMLRHALAANAFATSLIAVTILIISLFTGNIVAVGVEIILLIIDAFLSVFGESALAAKLAAALQDVSLVASPNADFQYTHFTQDPDLGLVAPSTVEFTASILEQAIRQEPDNWMAEKYSQFWEMKYVYESAVATTLTSEPAQETYIPTHGSMNRKWYPLDDHVAGVFGVEKYKVFNHTIQLEEPGINDSLPRTSTSVTMCLMYLAYTI